MASRHVIFDEVPKVFAQTTAAAVGLLFFFMDLALTPFWPVREATAAGHHVAYIPALRFSSSLGVAEHTRRESILRIGS